MKKIVLALAVLFALSGCDSKKYYKPQKIDAKLGYTEKLPTKLMDISRSGAVYQDGKIITKTSGVLPLKLPKGFTFVNADEDWVTITSGTGEMKILSKTGEPLFEKSFETSLAGATLKNGLLAMLFVDNTIMLYDIKADQLIYKEPLARAVALDARVANPLFLNDLVVFATLDGRLLIMDSTRKIVLRDTAISDKEFFNNVMFLDVLDNTMIAATSSKIIAINPKSIYNVNIDVKDVIYDDTKSLFYEKWTSGAL